jgi:hypothetical protein
MFFPFEKEYHGDLNGLQMTGYGIVMGRLIDLGCNAVILWPADRWDQDLNLAGPGRKVRGNLVWKFGTKWLDRSKRFCYYKINIL